MNKINWDEVQEASEFDNPKPGAYIATICRVEDVEEMTAGDSPLWNVLTIS